ncbi:MAG: M23 family metallopeptidase [Xanthomonadales bacterium]|nr:M23 family metallopeptidase [Xanthomonadales bacterium]
MKTKLTAILAIGKKYKPTLQNDHGRHVLSVLVLVLAFSMFAIGRWSSPAPVLLQKAVADMRLEVLQQQQLLDQLSWEQEISVNALAARLAELQAASTRLDALGERLVKLGQLDPEEFDFSRPPPVGGPEKNILGSQVSAMDMMESIDHMSQILHKQFARLDALQLLLLDRNLEAERTPAGWPVSSGWISSGFGERNDPFTGKRAQHEGLDFAGVKGSEILGVASGVVTWSGNKQGYGKLLEIDHGNGYVTRYAHNDELLVKAGEEISAGQVIAKMGASGRASSPHVHFEVLQRGKPVNPYQFVKQMR